MATTKKPTAKQLAARKKFAEAAKAGKFRKKKKVVKKKTTKKAASTHPKVGSIVTDKYDGKRKKIVGVSGSLYFVGRGHEPVRRHEFTFRGK